MHSIRRDPFQCGLDSSRPLLSSLDYLELSTTTRFTKASAVICDGSTPSDVTVLEKHVNAYIHCGLLV